MRRRRGGDSLEEFNYYYNPDLPTKILIHGWKSSTQTDTIRNIKNGYLAKNDCNVIGRWKWNISFTLSTVNWFLFQLNERWRTAVDWSALASNNFYPVPARQTREVGRYTAELIDYLCRERGSNVKDFHLVGHSLGEYECT